ncbi:MAG: phosphatidate cytidylyltransferase [Proteobacteria bacterium]|jgi:phosphatidate cytidylyltransferase|nr:phosphatidate cytidylyltransferase [Pseudomonadota bacterium]MCG6935781.1 phosphatidate cytidylyltransferase [Pseudomonadota bacterium]
MLKQRVLTGLVLGPLIIWGIFALPETAFNLILAAVIGLAAWEWARLGNLQDTLHRIMYAGLILAVLYGVSILPQPELVMQGVFVTVLLWWLVVVFRLFNHWQRALPTGISALPTLLAGLPVLAGFFFGLVQLRLHYGPVWILALLLLIWIADSAAYFVGRRFGRRKLLVSISPGKSWEGVYAALLSSLLVAGAIAYYFHRIDHLAMLVGICLLTVLISIVGDLNESYYKRRAGLKDSSQLLPGHGGILDRIDSLTAAVPVFYVSLMVFGL